MTTISIITPSYNQVQYIGKTIDSILAQQGNFLIEYFVEDGGSTDGTVDLLKRYEKLIQEDPRYTHITFNRVSEQDRGQSHAINKGFAKATGDIMAYLNSDDTYEPGCLHNVTEIINKSGKKRCYGKCRIIDQNDKIIRARITQYKNLWIKSKRSYSKLLTENYISQMATFWTKEAFEVIGEFNENEHLCMDYEYWLRLGKKFEPAIIDSYLANFRYYQESKSGSLFEKQFSDQFRLSKEYAEKNHKINLFIHRLFTFRTICIYKFLAYFKI